MVLEIATTWLTRAEQRPLLVVGPSLGTSSTQLWGPCVQALDRPLDVLGWDLPGHGGAPVGGPFIVAGLAAAVLAAIDTTAAGRPFVYAGDSLGGAVGVQLLLVAPQRVTSAVLISTGARIGEPSAWTDRATTVRAGGTDAVVEGSVQRWFAQRTRAECPQLVAQLMKTLREVDDEGYAQCCDALAVYDCTDRLGEISAPVLAVAGQEDAPTPVSSLATIADGVLHGRLEVLDDAAHLPPAERPDAVADLLAAHLDRLQVAT